MNIQNQIRRYMWCVQYVDYGDGQNIDLRTNYVDHVQSESVNYEHKTETFICDGWQNNRYG